MVAAVALGVFLSSGSGDERPAVDSSGIDADCDGSTTRDLEGCAVRELADAEAVLAAVLRDVRDGAEGRIEALDTSQRLWEEHRDVFCGALGDDQGGTLGPVNVATCAAGLAHERARAICGWISPNAALDALDDPPSACVALRD